MVKVGQKKSNLFWSLIRSKCSRMRKKVQKWYEKNYWALYNVLIILLFAWTLCRITNFKPRHNRVKKSLRKKVLKNGVRTIIRQCSKYVFITVLCVGFLKNTRLIGFRKKVSNWYVNNYWAMHYCSTFRGFTIESLAYGRHCVK